MTLTAVANPWMRLPIVDIAERLAEIDWLRVQRVVPATPLRARLDVRRTPRERRRLLHAAHHEDHDGDHAELDAMRAGALIAAVRVLVELGAPADEVTDDVGGVRHEVEVSWCGIVHRYVVGGDAVDDALGGVLRVASELLDAEPRITSVEPDRARSIARTRCGGVSRRRLRPPRQWLDRRRPSE